MNLQDGIEKLFGSREREYSMEVNDYLCTMRTNEEHAKPNYGPGKYKFEIGYYIQTYYSPEKLAQMRKTGKSDQKVVYS